MQGKISKSQLTDTTDIWKSIYLPKKAEVRLKSCHRIKDTQILIRGCLKIQIIYTIG